MFHVLIMIFFISILCILYVMNFPVRDSKVLLYCIQHCVVLCRHAYNNPVHLTACIACNNMIYVQRADDSALSVGMCLTWRNNTAWNDTCKARHACSVSHDRYNRTWMPGFFVNFSFDWHNYTIKELVILLSSTRKLYHCEQRVPLFLRRHEDNSVDVAIGHPCKKFTRYVLWIFLAKCMTVYDTRNVLLYLVHIFTSYIFYLVNPS